MRSLIILCTLFGASLALPVQRENVSPGVYEDRLNKTVECIRISRIKGNPEIGLPSYDPLVLNDTYFDLTELLGSSAIQGNVSLKSFKIMDTMKFTLVKIEAIDVQDPNNMKFHVIAEWPVYSLEGQYDVNVHIQGTKIQGKGWIREVLKKCRYDVKFQTALPLNPENFSVKVSLEEIDFLIDELIINGENVTDQVNKGAEKAVEWLNKNNDQVNTSITRMMLTMINTAYYTKKYKQEVVDEYKRCWDESA